MYYPFRILFFYTQAAKRVREPPKALFSYLSHFGIDLGEAYPVHRVHPVKFIGSLYTVDACVPCFFGSGMRF